MILILSIVMSLFYTNVHAQETDKNVRYEYKKYEKIDLGNLEVRGELIAPGDITVREAERQRFMMQMYERTQFDDFINKEIELVR
jgi:hypothetical protein